MIYQMQIYYGASLNGQAIYTMENSLEDCRKMPEIINDEPLRKLMENTIRHDGLSPDDFEIGFLTKEQYDNRYNPENEKTETWTISR